MTRETKTAYMITWIDGSIRFFDDLEAAKIKAEILERPVYVYRAVSDASPSTASDAIPVYVPSTYVADPELGRLLTTPGGDDLIDDCCE